MTSRLRYYITDQDEDWFLKGSYNEQNGFSFTGEIESAYYTYNKKSALDLSEKANALNMNTKVVIIKVDYIMWNANVTKE